MSSRHVLALGDLPGQYAACRAQSAATCGMCRGFTCCGAIRRHFEHRCPDLRGRPQPSDNRSDRWNVLSNMNEMRCERAQLDSSVLFLAIIMGAGHWSANDAGVCGRAHLRKSHASRPLGAATHISGPFEAHSNMRARNAPRWAHLQEGKPSLLSPDFGGNEVGFGV